MNGRPNSRESAMLILQRGGEAGLTWPLEHKTLMIGRSADCDIVLDDRQVSRFHARVVWRSDQYEVEDLGSKNGTHLNGRDLIGPLPLRDGDEIQIALRYKLAFVDAGATAPLVLEGESERGLRLDTVGHQVWLNGKLVVDNVTMENYWERDKPIYPTGPFVRLDKPVCVTQDVPPIHLVIEEIKPVIGLLLGLPV